MASNKRTAASKQPPQNRATCPAGEEVEDVSKLRRPIQIAGKVIDQVLNGIHYGTPELRCLLRDECDMIFECKVGN